MPFYETIVTGTLPSQLPTGTIDNLQAIIPLTIGMPSSPQTIRASLQQVSNSMIGDGWQTLPAGCTFVSSDNPSFVVIADANVTGTVGLGTKFRLTHQSSTKHFFVTSVLGVTGSNTWLNLYGGTDYTLNVTGSITNPQYSLAKAPFGFPLIPTKWTVQTTDTTQRSQASPVQNTWYNLGSVSISIPIGVWRTSIKATLQGNLSSAADLEVQSTLSTANNSESDADYTSVIYGFVQALRGGVYVEKILTVASKTSYYYNTRTTVASVVTIYNVNDIAKLVINAECAYL